VLNKDKRSLILCFALGDGCLHYIKNAGSLYGGLTIDHGLAQADYVSWKAKMLTEICGRNVKMRTGHKGNSIQVSVCMKRIRAWRKHCYPHGKKSINRILRFIRHPELATAIWLMDDGYVEPTIQNGKLYSASLRIFSCDETDQAPLIAWFTKHMQVTPRVLYQRRYPFLKFNAKDSLLLWKTIRGFVLQFKSMQHKFRHIEQRFQFKMSTAPTSSTTT